MTEQTSSIMYVAKGLKLLTHKQLRSFVLIPIMINAVLFIALNVYVISNLDTWNQWLIENYTPDWEWLRSALDWLLYIVVTIAILVGSAYSFNFVAALIAAPFNGLLAERAEQLISGVEVPAEPISKMVFRTLGRELRKLAYFIPRGLAILLLCFLIGFIPVVGLIAPIIAFWWTSWSLSIQYSDYCFDNHQVAFPSALSSLKETRLQSLGFGASIGVISMVPILNWFIMPAAVIGGVVYWVEQHQAKYVSA